MVSNADNGATNVQEPAVGSFFQGSESLSKGARCSGLKGAVHGSSPNFAQCQVTIGQNSFGTRASTADGESIETPSKGDGDAPKADAPQISGGRSALTPLMVIVVIFSAMTGFLMGYDLCIIAVVLNPIKEEFQLCKIPEPINLAEFSDGAASHGRQLSEGWSVDSYTSSMPSGQSTNNDFTLRRLLPLHTSLLHNFPGPQSSVLNVDAIPSPPQGHRLSRAVRTGVRRLSNRPCSFRLLQQQEADAAATFRERGGGDEYSSCFPKELFVSMVSPGGAVGSLSAGFVADALGRRFTLGLSDFLIMVGGFLLALGQVYWVLLAGRFFIGLGVGVGFVIFSTYISEIAPNDRRGQLVSCQEVAQCVGCLSAYAIAAIGGNEEWRWLLAAAGIAAAAQVIGVFFLPESPRWYVRAGRSHKALQALGRLAGIRVPTAAAADGKATVIPVEALEKGGALFDRTSPMPVCALEDLSVTPLAPSKQIGTGEHLAFFQHSPGEEQKVGKAVTYSGSISSGATAMRYEKSIGPAGLVDSGAPTALCTDGREASSDISRTTSSAPFGACQVPSITNESSTITNTLLSSGSRERVEIPEGTQQVQKRAQRIREVYETLRKIEVEHEEEKRHRSGGHKKRSRNSERKRTGGHQTPATTTAAASGGVVSGLRPRACSADAELGSPGLLCGGNSPESDIGDDDSNSGGSSRRSDETSSVVTCPPTLSTAKSPTERFSNRWWDSIRSIAAESGRVGAAAAGVTASFVPALVATGAASALDLNDSGPLTDSHPATSTTRGLLIKGLGSCSSSNRKAAEPSSGTATSPTTAEVPASLDVLAKARGISEDNITVAHTKRQSGAAATIAKGSDESLLVIDARKYLDHKATADSLDTSQEFRTNGARSLGCFSTLPFCGDNAGTMTCCKHSAGGSLTETFSLFRRYKRQLIIAVGCAVCQNLSGATAVLYYSTDIFTLANIANPLLPGVGIGVAKLLGILTVLYAVEKLGRKTFLMAGTIGSFICLLLFAAAFQMREHSVMDPFAPGLTVATMFVYMFCQNISWAGLMFVVASEVLPSSVRGLGMGLTITTFWVTAFISQSTLETLMAHLGISSVFLLYAAMDFLAILFTYFQIPEMSGKSLEEIAEDFRK